MNIKGGHSRPAPPKTHPPYQLTNSQSRFKMARFALIALAVTAVFGLAQAKRYEHKGNAHIMKFEKDGDYGCKHEKPNDDKKQALLHKHYKKKKNCGETLHVKDRNTGKKFEAKIVGFSDEHDKHDVIFSHKAYKKLSHPHHADPEIKWHFSN